MTGLGEGSSARRMEHADPEVSGRGQSATGPQRPQRRDPSHHTVRTGDAPQPITMLPSHDWCPCAILPMLPRPRTAAPRVHLIGTPPPVDHHHVHDASTVACTRLWYSRGFSWNSRAASELAGEFGLGSHSSDWIDVRTAAMS